MEKETKDIKQQLVDEILSELLVPFFSVLFFGIWVYSFITQKALSGILLFPLCLGILFILYFFTEIFYTWVFLSLITGIGFLSALLSKEPYAMLLYPVEVIVIWLTFAGIMIFRDRFENEKNKMFEDEDIIETKLAIVDSETSEIQKRKASLVRQIAAYWSLGQIVQIFSSTLDEEKIEHLIVDTALKFIGRGNWVIKKGVQGNIFYQYMKKSRLPLIIGNIAEEQRFYIKHPKFASMVAIPIEVNNEFWGTLEGTSPLTYEFDDSDLRMLSVVVGVASLALNNINLYERIQELAITDGLTGLYVQSYFKERLEEEFQRTKLHNLYLSLAIIDIDHFKDFNDTYGHMAGDSILRQLSDLLRQRLRETDFVCRYGGEEFAVIMMQTDLKEVNKVCEDIRKSVENEKFYLPVESFKPVHVHVTISIGISNFSENIKSSKEFIQAADEALYSAKINGRNRTEVKL